MDGTTSRLRIDLELLPHPFLNDPEAKLEAWGRILISIVGSSKKQILLEKQWDILELADWFAEHRQHICRDTFPELNKLDAPRTDESLAQAIERAYASGHAFDDVNDEAEIEEWADAVREPVRLYQEGHSLHRALRGSGVPPMIIGCNHGAGEISLTSLIVESTHEVPKGTYGDGWSYRFDMEDFCRHLNRELCDVIRKWLSQSEDPVVHRRANNLLKSLEGDVTGCCSEQ